MKTASQDAAMPRRAYSYTRFSQGKQAQGDSERRQTEWPAVVCGEQGWTLDDTLTFVDRGRSGFHGHNRKPTAALSHFLDLVERGRITRGSVLIIENIDRLSRQDVDSAHDLFRSIIRAGVWICTRTPSRIYKGEKDSSFIDLLEPIWIMYCAYMESLKKSQRVAGAWEASRRSSRLTKTPHQSAPPWWIRRVGDGYQLDEAQAHALRRAVELLQQGYGFCRLTAKLTAEGFPGPSRSGRWTTSGLFGALHGRAIVGEYQPHQTTTGKRSPSGPPIPGFYPALLTEDEWADVQAAIAGRKRKCGRPATQGENLFTGMVRDALTRHTLAQRPGGHYDKGQRYRYLQVWNSPGDRVTVRYEDFESLVLDTLAILRPSDVLDPAARTDEQETRIAALTARLTSLAHRQKQLQADAADPDKDYLLPVLDQVSADLKASAQERDRLQLETRSGRAEALAEAQTLRQLRDETQGEERAELDRRIKAALPSVVSEIWLQAQRVSPRHQIVHVQIYLRGGACRYVQLLPRNLHGAHPWDLAAVDLRRGPHVEGNEADVAALAETA